MTPNLHELANARGYGTAQAVLRNSGHWDESKALESPAPGLKRWKIKLEATVSYLAEAIITVEADDEEEALEAAWAKVTDSDWDECGSYDTDPEYGCEEVLRVEQLEDCA